jgi:hypothetical protein
MSIVLQLRVLPPALLVMVWLAASLLVADDESMEELLAKAQSSRDQQAELYAKVARRQVEIANQHFNDGDVDKAQAAVQDVVGFAQKALDSAKQVRKRLKQTDITLRKTSRRLADIAGTLAFEYRPPVNRAVKEIEVIRMQILDIMFGPSKKSDKQMPAEGDQKSQEQP